MFRLFGLLFVGLVLAGCASPTKMIESGTIKLGMSKHDFESKMFWGTDVYDDPGMENHGGSGYMPNFYDYTIVYGGNRDKIFVFDPKSILVAITDDIEEAEQLVLLAVRSNSKVHDHQSKLATTTADVSTSSATSYISKLSDASICSTAVGNYTKTWIPYSNYTKEAKRRGLSCGVSGISSAQIASTNTTQSDMLTSAELTAAQKETDRLRQELAALKAQQEQQQKTISSDTQIPLITIASAGTKGKQGVIRGRASDNVGVAEVTVDGNTIAVHSNGNFEYSTFVPATGLTLTVQVTDMAGLSSKQTVSLQRNVNLATATINFDRLNPIGKRTKQNSNALALIIGVSVYENTPAKAVFADADAMMFRDYASEKLGIPDNRIKTMVNDGAGERELLLSVKSWLSRSVKKNQSDVYIFFAGHGLASDDGSKMYLLPYDGAPELLNKTAILRDELFADISAANPRSVTVFLDTCYSGTTRGTDILIASRPIAIRALEQSIPDNFTVMTAAAGDQTAKPLEEAKHGMFSYFLMKGMEGEADANNDNEITAGELHSYVQTNVIQQSSGSQTPELQGDATRVLVRFQ